MFTPDSLIDMSINFTAQADALQADALSDISASLRQQANDAENCAVWMETNGVREASMIGPFGNLRIDQHSKVKIKKGAVVHGMGNDIPQGGKVSTRANTVIIRWIDRGIVSDAVFTGEKITVRNQAVHWTGAGGYWRWTDAANVILPGIE